MNCRFTGCLQAMLLHLLINFLLRHLHALLECIVLFERGGRLRVKRSLRKRREICLGQTERCYRLLDPTVGTKGWTKPNYALVVAGCKHVPDLYGRVDHLAFGADHLARDYRSFVEPDLEVFARAPSSTPSSTRSCATTAGRMTTTTTRPARRRAQRAARSHGAC